MWLLAVQAGERQLLRKLQSPCRPRCLPHLSLLRQLCSPSRYKRAALLKPSRVT